MVATVIAALLVIGLTLFSQYTKQGRALRAVADDHQAALSVGISLRFIWVLVWSIAGFVALVAGMMWGAKSGVQFSLSLIALKALPVLMLGGFTSIPGAIVGGLIIGVGEKLFEFSIGPDDRRRDRELVRLCAGVGVSGVPAAGPVRRQDYREGVKMHKQRIGVVCIDCKTDDLTEAAAFWSAMLGKEGKIDERGKYAVIRQSHRDAQGAVAGGRP